MLGLLNYFHCSPLTSCWTGAWCHSERGCGIDLGPAELEPRHPPGWNDRKGRENLRTQKTSIEGVNRFTAKRGRFQQKFCLETDLAAYEQNWENGSQIKEENFGIWEKEDMRNRRGAFLCFFLFLITKCCALVVIFWCERLWLSKPLN